EAGLGSGRSFYTAKGKRATPIVEIGDVEHQVLHPQRRPLADGRELCRLQMCVSERWLVAPGLGERREGAQNIEHLAAKEVEPTPHQDQIGVVRDVGARRSKMNEWFRRRSDVTERMNVRHHIVPETLLIGGD